MRSRGRPAPLTRLLGTSGGYRVIRTTAEVSGRRGSPDRPEQGARPDRDDQDRERVKPERRPVGDRLDELLEDPVCEQDHHRQRQRVSGPAPPRAISTAKPPATQAPM